MSDNDSKGGAVSVDDRDDPSRVVIATARIRQVGHWQLPPGFCVPDRDSVFVVNDIVVHLAWLTRPSTFTELNMALSHTTWAVATALLWLIGNGLVYEQTVRRKDSHFEGGFSPPFTAYALARGPFQSPVVRAAFRLPPRGDTGPLPFEADYDEQASARAAIEDMVRTTDPYMENPLAFLERFGKDKGQPR